MTHSESSQTPAVVLRIGTRASHLARWQADWVADALRSLGAEVEIVEIITQGDTNQSGPIAGLGIQGVFTKEIQNAVLEGRVDIAVHSLKDLPTLPTPGLRLAAVPAREDPRDALLSRSGASLAELPAGARVGTGSARRRAQLLAIRKDLALHPIRGNVDTRIRKLEAGEYDAIVLAAAGLRRLGLTDHVTQYLDPTDMLPAPGQGALGLECRQDDSAIERSVAQLDDRSTRLATAAERAVLATLHGGCSAPIAAHAQWDGQDLLLRARVTEVEGRTTLQAESKTAVSDPEGAASAGEKLAAQLQRQGADRLIPRA
jgi:hydroxymethylbilane synthase